MSQHSGYMYNPKKYCLTVHSTIRKVIVQVACTTTLGDKIGTQATSTMRPLYDANTLLKNHSAAFLAGLLAAQGTLMKFGLTKLSRGTKRLMGRVTMSRSRRTVNRDRSSVPWKRVSRRSLTSTLLRRTSVLRIGSSTSLSS